MNAQLQEMRVGYEQMGLLYPKSENVSTEATTIEGTTCYWITPKNANTDKVIYYVHGGALVLGFIKTYESFLTHVAERLRTPILYIEYGLAPETPYPGALNQIVEVYGNLLANHSDKEIILMGDSAGGGLSIRTLAELNAKGKQSPAAMVLLSPWVDYRCESPTYESNKDKDAILQKEILAGSAQMYLQGADMEAANPAQAKFTQVPPTLVFAGGNEILLNDSEAYVAKIKPLQAQVKFVMEPEGQHVWPLGDVHADIAKRTLSSIKGFIQGL